MPIFNKKSEREFFYITTIRDIVNENQYHIVPAYNLKQLLQDDKCMTKQYDGKTYKVLRFLLKTNGELVFAHEGAPGGIVPSHWQMTQEEDYLSAACLTAGNAFFNEDGVLQFIDHKSGDFRPSFESLQFMLPELIKNAVVMANFLEIRQLDSFGVVLNSYHMHYDQILLAYYHSNSQDAPSLANANTLTAPITSHVDLYQDENNVLTIHANKQYPDEEALITSQSRANEQCYQNEVPVQKLTDTKQQSKQGPNKQVQRNTLFYHNENTARQHPFVKNRPEWNPR